MLKRTDKFPPGGFPFFQPETGVHFKNMTDFETQARQIAVHRRGNNLPRATLEECMVDLDAYTCARIGGDPKYCCSDNSKVTEQAVTRIVRKCGGCGGRRKK